MLDTYKYLQSLIGAAAATLVLCATIALAVTNDTRSESSVHNLMLAARQASMGFVGRDQSLYGEQVIESKLSQQLPSLLTSFCFTKLDESMEDEAAKREYAHRFTCLHSRTNFCMQRPQLRTPPS